MKTFFSMLFLLAYASASAGTVTINGQISNPKENKVYVVYYLNMLNYEKAVADSATLDKEGKFSMRFNWDKPSPVEFFHAQKNINMFLTPGDDLQINANANNLDSSIYYKGKGAEINNYLAQKALMNKPFYTAYYKMPEAVFTRMVDSVHTQQLIFFNNWFKAASKKDQSLQPFFIWEDAEINYSWGTKKNAYPGSFAYFNQQPSPPVLPENYYSFRKSLSLQQVPEAMLSFAYLSYLEGYTYEQAEKQAQQNSSLNKTDLIFSFIEQEFKGELREYLYAKWIYMFATNYKDIVSADKYLSKYKSFAKNKTYLEILDANISFLGALLPGKPAPDFLATDLSGKVTKLSNFKGKLIYIDVWASWCGPCLREIPHAEKLQEEMKGKDVLFMCVSVDENTDAWKNTIKARNIGGLHLLSNGSLGNDVSSLYRINGIPHYIIVDKDGKIIDSNAKRPSQGVIADLEKLLQ